MSHFEHFPKRNILLPETTDAELQKFGVAEALIPTGLLLPPLPQNFSIRGEMTAVQDQGSQGSCTTFCVVACLEHVHKGDRSEAQVQHEAERAHGDCAEGLAMVHGFEICKAQGAVDETVWPYDPSQVCWANPPNTGGAPRVRFAAYGYVYNRPRSAILNVLSNAAALSSTPGLPLTLQIQRQLFARRRPVAISVPVVWTAWPWNGEVQMPSPAAATEFFAKAALPHVDGWHCIAICGWDNSTGRFLFKNSWGPSWGNGGYGTIPYQYVENYSDTGIVGW